MTRAGLGLAFLLAQAAWVLTEQRPRLWAPFHEHAVYSLSVQAEGRALSTAQALERYRLPAWHASKVRDEAWETNDLQHVKDVIVAHEAGTRGEVVVELRARVNGEDQPAWRWAR